MTQVQRSSAVVQYVAARAAAAALLSMDIESALSFGAAAGRMLYLADRRHAMLARRHIAAAFSDWTPERVAATAEAAFEHLAMLGVEVIHAPRALHPGNWDSILDVSSLSPEVVGLLNGRRALVMLTGHQGNWEILGYGMACIGYPVHAVARPLNNPYINRWLLGIREKRGMTILDKGQASHKARAVLGRGDPVGFIADQSAGPKGIFVPFLGRLASAYKSVGVLAMAVDVPVVCGHAVRTPTPDGRRFRYAIQTTDIIHPEEWRAQPDPMFYLTARWARAIEQAVESHPEQYLWMHRRWKDRPKFIQNGENFPAELRDKLFALPWMDATRMAQLEAATARELEEVRRGPRIIP